MLLSAICAGHHLRRHTREVADGGPTLAVADQVELLHAIGRGPLLHLLEQLLAAHRGAVDFRHRSHIDLGAVLAQLVGHLVKIVHAQDVLEAHEAVHQHDGVTGGGSFCGRGCGGLGLGAQHSHGGNTQGGQPLTNGSHG